MSATVRRLTLMAAVPLLAVGSAAQKSTAPSSSSGSTNSYPGLGNANTYDRPDLLMEGYNPSLSHRQYLARRQEAHNRMVENATRLLALAREVQESIRLHEPTASDARSLDDIAKLARAVRDGMRQ